MNIKTTLTTITALTAVIVLTGCGTTEPEPTPVSTPPVVSTPATPEPGVEPTQADIDEWFNNMAGQTITLPTTPPYTTTVDGVTITCDVTDMGTPTNAIINADGTYDCGYSGDNFDF